MLWIAQSTVSLKHSACLMKLNMALQPFLPHLPPLPSSHLHKHIHSTCQVAWHISFKAALKAFLLGVHLMKSALKALFLLADTSQPSVGPWPDENKRRDKEKTFFYSAQRTGPVTFNICQKPLPASNTVACSCVVSLLLFFLLSNVNCSAGTVREYTAK